MYQFFRGEYGPATLLDHARSGDAAKIRVGNAVLDRGDQGRTQHVTGGLSRYDADANRHSPVEKRNEKKGKIR